jgi:hypothetical protein
VFDNSAHPFRVRINAAKQENDMKTKTTNSGLKVKANIKAGGIDLRNHNRTGLRIKAGIKGGSMISVKNHNANLLAL